MGSVVFEGSSVVFPVLDKLASVVVDPVVEGELLGRGVGDVVFPVLDKLASVVADPVVEGELVGRVVGVVAVLTVVGLGLGLGQT